MTDIKNAIQAEASGYWLDNVAEQRTRHMAVISAFTAGATFAQSQYEARIVELRIELGLTRNNLSEAKMELLELKRDKWVKIDERKPDESGEYLCWNNDLRKMEILTYQVKAQRWENNRVIRLDRTITHWQDKPAPPNESV